MVGVGSQGVMNDALWKRFIDDLGTARVTKWLSVVSGTMEFTSIQRKMGIDTAKRRNIQICAVIDSGVVRGLITAAAWFGLNIKSFPPEQLAEAVHFLGVKAPMDNAVISAVKRLQK